MIQPAISGFGVHPLELDARFRSNDVERWNFVGAKVWHSTVLLAVLDRWSFQLPLVDGLQNFSGSESL